MVILKMPYWSFAPNNPMLALQNTRLTHIKAMAQIHGFDVG
jgi:hypothetical protein